MQIALTVLGWAALAGSLAFLWWHARRRGDAAKCATANLRVERTLRLTPQHSIHLLEFGSRRILVACHPRGAAVLARGEQRVRPREAHAAAV